ncbi:MAG: ATP phosphoribosyltransferase [Muribaculaceae bacterium]|nr:ATP phosphoribosyltransferase [Muribaculaceae bacterium]
MIRLAIQSKGRLSEQSISLLKESGINVPDSKRHLLAQAKGFDLEILFLRDDDIPQAVASGVADAGIVGRNVVAEKGETVDTLMPLGFGACRLSIAVPNTADYTGSGWLNGKKIATSYPAILKNWLAGNNISAGVHLIEGSVEISPAIGIADAIFDIVSSGGTLVANGLREVETVMESEADLIACPGLDAGKRALIDKLVFRFNSVIHSRGVKYVLMNIPHNKVDEAIKILPGMRSPTVLPLAQPGWCSIHSVVPEDALWQSIEQLKKIGAEGILVLALENIIR